MKAAAAHLCKIFGQDPRDAVAQARLGVVEAWQRSYGSAARRLSKLSEKDSSTLGFLLALIPFNHKKCTAQVSMRRNPRSRSSVLDECQCHVLVFPVETVLFLSGTTICFMSVLQQVSQAWGK